MVIQKELLMKLRDFNLNSYEGKLWIALLSRGVSTAGELSDISNVPRSRTYDVLESLEKKGFIIVKVGKPIKYLAVHPSEVLERVKKKIVEEAEQKNKILATLKDSDVLEELNKLHNKGVEMIDPTDRSGSFRGREKVHDHLVSMVNNAKKNIFMVLSKDGVKRKYSLLQNNLTKAARRGVSIKIVAPPDADQTTLENFSSFAKVKKAKNTARFCIIDEKDLLLFLTDDQKTHPSYDSAIWVEAPNFVKYFSELFEKEWRN